MISRRDFGKIAAAAIPLGRMMAAEKINSKIAGVQIGAQTYSFRDRPLDACIAAMKEIGLGECELFMGHVEPAGLSGDELKKWRLTVPMDYFHDVRRKFDDAGIWLYAYTLNFSDRFSDEELDRGFEMTKALGTNIITTSTTLSCAKRLAPLADKHKVKVAMHGHSNITDPNQFAKPESFTQALQMSKNFHINLDIGHFYAAGYDPVAFLQEHHDKVLAIHVKDRKRPADGAATPWGQGGTPIMKVLDLVRDKKWKFPCNIEYEYNVRGTNYDTVAEVTKCFQYCKDALTKGAAA
jgi:sugar phosphate isomerase/epimerase